MVNQEGHEIVMKIDHKRVPIACMSWTTASGDITPLWFKVVDESGAIQTIKPLEVLSSEQKDYYTSPLMWYRCRAVINELSKVFTIIYLAKTMKWELLIEE